VNCGGDGRRLCKSGCGRVSQKNGVCYNDECGGEGAKLCENGCGRVVYKNAVCYNVECGGKGKKLCDHPDGCKNHAQSSGKDHPTGIPGIEGRCVIHLGGLRCDEEGCQNSARYSTRETGLDGKCRQHGGGDRCEEDCCEDLLLPTIAKYIDPDTNKGICTFFARCMVNEERFVLFNEARAVYLEKYFNFGKPLLLRAEHAFYFELVKRVPELALFPAEDRALDQTVRSALYGKTKNVKDYRPDSISIERRC